LLAEKFPSLFVNEALIGCVPTDAGVYVQVALEPLKLVEPDSHVIAVPLSVNATAPVIGPGGVWLGVVTVAVSVTCWPMSDGFADDVSAVLVLYTCV
jgi:hypothetical protein